MTLSSASNPLSISINSDINHIDIKGQYITLAAPVRLQGHINVSELALQYFGDKDQKLDQESDYSLLQIGVDEAGRGPLLGCVMVAAAILPYKWSGLIESNPLAGTSLSLLTDSKQLSEKKRDLLYPLLKQQLVGYVIADIPAVVIDQINILQATMLGMRLCSEALLNNITVCIANDTARLNRPIRAELLFDGNRCPELNDTTISDSITLDCQAWVKGDARHTSMAAASVLAKVSRDQKMYILDKQYLDYGIAQHKGYPTRAHIAAIENYGVLSEHRQSFSPIKKVK